MSSTGFSRADDLNAASFERTVPDNARESPGCSLTGPPGMSRKGEILRPPAQPNSASQDFQPSQSPSISAASESAQAARAYAGALLRKLPSRGILLDIEHGPGAEQREAEYALERRQHAGELGIERNPAIAVDVNAIAGQQLIVGLRSPPGGDPDPIDRQHLVA